MTGSRAFTVYGAVMVALVAVAPLVRLAWNGLAAPEVWTALSAPTAPLAAAGIVLCVWAAALVAGTARGPAVLTPFAAHVHMRGPEPRWRIFARPMAFAAGAAVGAALLLAVAVTSAALQAGSPLPASAVGALAVAAVSMGLITVVLWAAGQTLAPVWVPCGTIVLGAAGVVLLALSPAGGGWSAAGAPAALPRPSSLADAGVGLARALVAGEGWAAGALMASLALAALAVLPFLLSRLQADRVVEDSKRWDLARMLAWDTDFSAAAGLYRALPARLRRIPAVRLPRARLLGVPLPALVRWIGMLVRRDAVGTARTPGRLVASLCGLVAAGLLAASSSMPETAWLAGAVTGGLIYAALGPLTDGLRGLAASMGDGPGLYGIGDGTLLGGHLVLPLTVGGAAVLAGLLVTAVLGAGAVSPATCCLAAAHTVVGVLLRLAAAFKPLPPVSLFSPVHTPLGDVAVLVRLGWALDAALLALLTGALLGTTAAGPGAAAGEAGALWPVLLIAALVPTTVLAARRWIRRRA